MPFIAFKAESIAIPESSFALLVCTYALYLMEGYSPKVEHSVAICSAIFSSSELRSCARFGLNTYWNASWRSNENTFKRIRTLPSHRVKTDFVSKYHVLE